MDPDKKGYGTSTTVVHDVTLEGLLWGDPKHVNVHKPGTGEPPPVNRANLNGSTVANRREELFSRVRGRGILRSLYSLSRIAALLCGRTMANCAALRLIASTRYWSDE